MEDRRARRSRACGSNVPAIDDDPRRTREAPRARRGSLHRGRVHGWRDGRTVGLRRSERMARLGVEELDRRRAGGPLRAVASCCATLPRRGGDDACQRRLGAADTAHHRVRRDAEPATGAHRSPRRVCASRRPRRPAARAHRRARRGRSSEVTRGPVREEQLRIVPANEASCEDLVAIFGTTDYPGRCQCQRFKIPGWIWRDSNQEERTSMLRSQTGCGDPDASSTSGLVAYVDGEPAGWVAVEPRTAYSKLRTSRVPWSGRDEDKNDDEVWAVTCFVVRKQYRGRALTYALARAAAEFARSRGARAVEGYPMVTEPGKEITWGEAHVGLHQVFDDAGFTTVTRPTRRRAVTRIDLSDAPE